MADKLSTNKNKLLPMPPERKDLRSLTDIPRKSLNGTNFLAGNISSRNSTNIT